MPELIILISAIACIGSAVVLYFNRSNAPAAGIAVISFIACLYGIGQHSAQDTGLNNAGWWKPYKVETDALDKTKKMEEPAPARQRAEVIPDEPAKQLPLPPPTQLNAVGSLSPTVIISSFTSRITATKYVEVSGRIVNMNEFPIKNVVVKCGDITFASFDVSAMLDKVVPAKSDLYIAGVRMGPNKPALPPSTCSIANFDRAD